MRRACTPVSKVAVERFSLMRKLGATCVVLLAATTAFHAGILHARRGGTDFYTDLREAHVYPDRATQCGVAVTYASLRWLGYDVSLKEIIRETPSNVFEHGMDVRTLRHVLGKLGAATKLTQASFADLSGMLSRGEVLIVPNRVQAHLIVYFGKRGDQFLRYDPPFVVGWVSTEEAAGEYEGWAIVVDPKSDLPGEGIGRFRWICISAVAGVGAFVLLLLRRVLGKP